MIQAASEVPGRVPARTVSRSQSQLNIVWRQLRRNRAAMLGAALIVAEIIIAIFAPLIAPYDPIEQSIYDALQPPSAQHWLGTDEVGPQHCIIATDLGVYTLPEPVEGLREFIACLLDLGISADDIRTLVATNPARLLGMDT